MRAGDLANDKEMKAISIRQPWAWMILNAGKDVENRDWKWLCKERGDILVHASKGMTHREYDEACEFAASLGVGNVPAFDRLKRGGIVGMVRVIDHVRHHKSKWFFGPTALVLSKPYPLPFRACPGELGFFTPKIF